MCGIAGILSLSPDVRVDPGLLRTMAGQLVHRGPDDEGFHVEAAGRCGLAFRRLAIIDLATGNQPLANEDQTVWAIFNGEIYNFRELRDGLRRRGHTFRTQGDAEVLVHLYEEHGEGCFAQLAGMFAIAIWDAARGRLLLARDRLGKKPLAYAILADRLYFASEAKALLALPGVPREVDPRALHSYLLFQYVPAPHSIFRSFAKIAPGTYQVFAAGRPAEPGATAARTYWRIPRPEPFAGTYADGRRRLGELLTRAVEKRLVADVPLGAFLSGGIDSSIVVALMRKLGVSPLRTFSIGFPDARYDETHFARAVAQRFGTEHHEHDVTPQAREVLETLAQHYDEPFADSSAIPTYYLARWTRQSVTVALTGDAGDECFAGYDRYRAAEMAARLAALPKPLRAGFSRAAGWVPRGQPKSATRRAYRFFAAAGEAPWRRYLAWVGVFPPELLAAAYRPEFAAALNEDADGPVEWFRGLYDDAPGRPANQAIHADFQSYLPYDLLTKVDIASMACSLECRCPFLDHELVEFALSLPLEWRLGPGAAGGVFRRRPRGKRILKDWAAETLGLPPAVLARRKMGFGVPIGLWFRRELREFLESRLFAPDGLSQRIFRPDWLRAFVSAHQNGRESHEHALWALLMLELWGRRWKPKLP